MLIYGIHPVEEMLRSRPRQAIRLFVASKSEAATAIAQNATANRIEVEHREYQALDEMVPEGNHQGVVLEVMPFQYVDLASVIANTADLERACVVILEQVQDPGNLGAILRSAAALGVAAVILPKDRACAVTAAVVRASAGLAYQVPVARVTNIARTLRDLKESGFWAVAAHHTDKSRDLWDIDFSIKCALVLGGEHQGIRRLVAQNCDLHARIPMAKGVESLNVASAAAIFFYEVRRQWSSLE